MYLIFLISISNIFGHNCYSNQTLNQSNWMNFNPENCHLQITIDYQNNILIKLYPIINSSDSNIKFSSIINFHDNNIQSITSTIDYICLSEKLCDIKKWIEKIPENFLHNNLISLWNNSNICQKKSKTNFCESYLCFLIYNELQHFQCHERFLPNSINIYIKTISGNIINEYQCTKNHCTGEVLYNLNRKKNSAENFLINPNQKKQLDFKRFILIIGILLFIGSIAYYIQCRKYNQGYKLTINA